MGLNLSAENMFFVVRQKVLNDAFFCCFFNFWKRKGSILYSKITVILDGFIINFLRLRRAARANFNRVIQTPSAAINDC